MCASPGGRACVWSGSASGAQTSGRRARKERCARAVGGGLGGSTATSMIVWSLAGERGGSASASASSAPRSTVGRGGESSLGRPYCWRTARTWDLYQLESMHCAAGAAHVRPSRSAGSNLTDAKERSRRRRCSSVILRSSRSSRSCSCSSRLRVASLWRARGPRSRTGADGYAICELLRMGRGGSTLRPATRESIGWRWKAMLAEWKSRSEGLPAGRLRRIEGVSELARAQGGRGLVPDK
ncbi:uncharacterized protein B0H18DRAFT_1047748 [Fomitopsis serialis]|uniref:uncharacterized protein n=1 Tax=Fomitopsis serialis TaxID=139415 RepID=UPI002007A00E|nr:uncharacterized protein B0H18DRAFT_1047748 [Neoantrodia serialis]KAH9913714.1 hypothetical protein B0H18DRAFT_1047748 [Neoantrodia serialis]